MIKPSGYRKHHSKTSRQSNPIIHARIRSTKNFKSIKKNISARRHHSRCLNEKIKNESTLENFDNTPRHYEQDSPSSQSKKQERPKNNDFYQNFSIKSNYSSKPSKVAPSRIEDKWANPSDYATKHDQNKNRKKKTVRKQYVVITLLSLFILIVTVIILLTVLLSRTRIKTSTKPCTVSLRWNTTGLTIAGVTNQSGNASNKLNSPFGLVVDYSNTLYIADSYNHRVQKYLRDASFGKTVAGQETGSSGPNANTFNYAADLVLEVNGDIYVSDVDNHRVQLWTSGSTTGVTVAGTGTGGNANNQLRSPYGITRDPMSSALYIVDRLNYRVMRYASNASFGTVAAGGNGQGRNNTQLYSPIGIHLDVLSNSLLIATYLGNNIVRWTLGASNWEIVAGHYDGTIGNTPAGLDSPIDVTLDPMGNCYVADYNNQRIQFFPVGERNGTTIAGVTGVRGTSATLLDRPASIKLDNQLNLYVSDRFNHRVQKFMRY